MADIFEKVKGNINKGISSVSDKSSNIIESTKLKKEISGLESQKELLLLQLGQSVYGMYLDGDIGDGIIASSCAVIGSLDDKIKDKNDDLKRLQNVCLVCESKFAPGSKFCPQCGNTID